MATRPLTLTLTLTLEKAMLAKLRFGVKVLLLLSALCGGYTAWQFADGGAERVEARYAAAREAVVPRAGAAGDAVVGAAERGWAGVEGNPVPVVAALGTFLLTVVYHKSKGKSLRQALEVATTRVHVVEPVGPPAATPPVSKVVVKAQQRTTYLQLVADRDAKESELKPLIERADKLTAEAEKRHTDLQIAEAVAAAKRLAAAEADAQVAALRQKIEQGQDELLELDHEIEQLEAAV